MRLVLNQANTIKAKTSTLKKKRQKGQLKSWPLFLLSEDVERLLEIMQQDYPALDYAEILNLGLSELYRKREKENRQAWIDSLPPWN